jgi:nucleoside-diphosphate-sugar epimerase
VNVEGTRNLIEAAESAGIKRFIHISALAVITGGKPVENADETWVIPKKPVGSYAQTKAIGEKVALSHHSSEFEVVVIRPPFVWGLGDQATLPILSEVAGRGKYLWLGGGEYPFSACHVRNVCEGILLAMERGRGGEVYFLTDGPRNNFREFFDALIRTQGVDPGERSVPHWIASFLAPIVEFVWRSLRLKGDPPLSRESMALLFSPLWVNDNKARAELGYKGHVSREEGLAELRAEADRLKQ